MVETWNPEKESNLLESKHDGDLEFKGEDLILYMGGAQWFL